MHGQLYNRMQIGDQKVTTALYAKLRNRQSRYHHPERVHQIPLETVGCLVTMATREGIEFPSRWSSLSENHELSV